MKPPHPAAPPRVLHAPGIVNGEGLDKVPHLIGMVDNEWGSTRLKVSGARDIDVTEALIFVIFFATGLVPPFSSFFWAVLEHFQVHMLHLHPNAVLVLAMFAHLCKAFVGAVPSLQLFRHFFSMHLISGDQISRCVSFSLTDEADGLGFPDLGLCSAPKN